MASIQSVSNSAVLKTIDQQRTKGSGPSVQDVSSQVRSAPKATSTQQQLRSSASSSLNGFKAGGAFDFLA